MKSLVVSLGCLVLVIGLNGCVAVSGQKNRDGIVESWSGVTPYLHLGSNDQPRVIASPYYSGYGYYGRPSYYRPSYSPSYRSYSSYGGGYRYDDCRGRIVRAPSYSPPRPATRVIGSIQFHVHH